MTHRFPLATSSWDEAEYAALQRVIRSDRFTMGANVAEFERRFSEHFAVAHAVMVNSGSSANLLMVAALFHTGNNELRLRRGDEVVVPAVSWSTTYFPLAQYGLRMKFVDIDRETLNYDLGALESAVTDRTRAIVAVNLLGNPNEFDATVAIAERHGAVVVEDNCEAMGATFRERYTGTFGVLGSFSSFFSHHISTMEGGVVVTDDEELYHLMLSLRAHGWTRDLPRHNRVTGEKSSDRFEESFRFVLPGYNLRPLELSGAVGIEQLRKLPDLVTGRRANALYAREVLGDHPDFMLQRETGESSWFGFSLVLREDSSLDRADLSRKLDQAGFEYRPIVGGNFTKNPVMRWLDYDIQGNLANAEYVDQRGLFVGNHHYPMKDAIDTLASI